MTARFELFVQGGLGNQLIQLAYAESLHARTGSKFSINPIMLRPFWSRMRSISNRDRCFQWASNIPEVKNTSRQLMGLLRLYSSKFGVGPITDYYTDEEILHKLTYCTAHSWFGFIGYFQRSQAFGCSAESFWNYLSCQLRVRLPLKPFPWGQVVAHVRLGDYLWPENQRIFSKYSISQQIKTAQRLSRCLGGPETVNLVTDDPENLRALLSTRDQGRFKIYNSANAEDDFLFIAQHRHIVGSNSTFSLCAGKLASALWGHDRTLTIPRRWYEDKVMDLKMQDELENLKFIYSFD